MMDLTKSFLVPFDPDWVEEDQILIGFLYGDFGYGKKWWLAEIKMGRSPKGWLSVYARSQDQTDKYFNRPVDDFRGCPWVPLQWPDPEIPDQHLPGYRLTLDCPGGERITRECGPEPEGLKKIASWLLVHAAKMEWRI